jgi:1,4-alpha-glucan branching enzyme
VVVCNLTPVPRLRYRIGLPQSGPWRELLNTDQIVYGGSGLFSSPGPTEPLPWQQRLQSLCLDLPPLACIVMQPGA